MKGIYVGDVLVSNRGVRHRIVCKRTIIQWPWSTRRPQLTLQSLNSGKRRKALLIDVTSWINYGKWTHIRIPKKIQLPVGI